MTQSIITVNTHKRSLLREWSWALSADSELSLLNNLLEELSAYFGVSQAEALRRGKEGDESLKEEWLKTNPQTAEEIAGFYKSSETYIYELMYWHSCTYDTRPLLYVPAVRLAHFFGAAEYLDFGAGVGSQGLLFAKHGVSVTLADIAPPMLDFCRWRFARHALPGHFIDLNTESLPEGKFDFITAMEVLEHVPNPFETVSLLARLLRPGGIIYFSAPFHEDELRPMHIVTDANALWAIRSLGLEKVHVRLPDPTFHVYRRVTRSQVHGRTLAAFDRIVHNLYTDELRRLPGRARNKVIYELMQLTGRSKLKP